MALKIKAPLRAVKPAVTVTAQAEPKTRKRRTGETVDGKTITVRMPPNHILMIEADMVTAECDRSELIKRAIRLQHNALSSWSSELITRDESGKQTSIVIMKNGVPV